jgi:hypothetical protein
MDDLLSSTVNNTKGPGSGGTLDQRLDHILAVLMETKAICEQNQREIVTLKEKIISLEKENNTVKRELRVAKESTNRYELATRFLTVRVLGLPVSAEERAAASPEDRNKAAVKNAYDKILRPILSVAKAKGHLEVVPQLKTTIEEGFRINSNAKDKRGVPYPPPLILRFTHKSYRTAVFLFKREAFNPSGGASSDNLNFFIVGRPHHPHSQQDEGAPGGRPRGQGVDHGGADQVHPGGRSVQGPQVPRGLRPSERDHQMIHPSIWLYHRLRACFYGAVTPHRFLSGRTG